MRNKNNMTTLSRQYKLSKNILFYIVQRHRSESGKMAANLRRGEESGGGGHAFEYDKQTKVHFVSENVFAIMLNIETFLNCCLKQGGIKCTDCYAPVLEYQSELYFYLYYMNLILLFGYHISSVSISLYFS